jgi:hypothetical protein
MAKKKNKKSPKEFSLDSVREQLEKGEQLAVWVEAAFEHRADFPQQVVLTVVGDYLVQWESLGPDLAAAADAVSSHRSGLVEKAVGLRDKAKEVEALIDELNLRHVIGELSADEFEACKSEARTNADAPDLDKVESSLADIDASLASVSAVVARLDEAVRMHQTFRDGGDPQAAVPEPGPPVDAAPPPADLGLAPLPEASAEPLEDATPAQEWDVPPGMDAGEPPPLDAPAPAPAAPEMAPPPPDQAPPPPEAPAPTWAAMDPEDAAGSSAGAEDLMATGVITARPELMASDAPPVQSTADFKVDSTSEGEGPRLAVFSPDGKEQTYLFGGEVMSMGRGRNNDIQIKNDGKISRYHCRIFRRGDEFIIEDNKSSNGTLVDSKLVTRQRLDGGEQIQIGETRVIFHL